MKRGAVHGECYHVTKLMWCCMFYLPAGGKNC